MDLPNSYSEAVSKGIGRFFTGRPCINGHISPRLTSSRTCMECHKERMRSWYQANRDLVNTRERERRQKNAEVNSAKRRENYAKNIEQERAKQRERRRCQPGIMREYDRRSREKSRVHRAISEGVRRSLSGGGKAGRRAFTLLGYTVDDLKAHLTSQFTEGMTWENYGEWEIDHIIPRAAFNFNSADDLDFKRCWALENLQPLWMADNRSKNASLDKPFQPSLALAVSANDNTPVSHKRTA